MFRPRISIAGYMILAVLCTLPMASLIVASDGWVVLTRYLTVATLCYATYLARYRKDDEGAWWFGFALVGWGFFALLMDSLLWGALATAQGGGRMLPMSVVTLFMSAAEIAETTARGQPIGPWENRSRILHYLLILFVAALGGLACWVINRKRGSPKDDWAWPSGVWRIGDDDPTKSAES
jgi:hypothetical protein